jgi:hypothetical protein
LGKIGAAVTVALSVAFYAGAGQPTLGSPAAAFDSAMVEELYVSAHGLWPFKYRRLAGYLSGFERCQVSFGYEHEIGTTPDGAPITVPWHVDVDVRRNGQLEGCILNRQAAASPASRDGLCFDNGRIVPAR